MRNVGRLVVLAVVLLAVGALAWSGGVPALELGAPPGRLTLAQALVPVALSTLVSEDLTCAAVGALVAQGRLGFLPGTLACFAGIFVGDLALFLAGRWLGARALARRPLVWFLSAERAAHARAWLERRGAGVVLSARFLPGTRLATYFASGMLGTSPARFLPWFALSALLWTPLLVGLSAGIGGTLARELAERGPPLAGAGLVCGLLTLAATALLIRILRGAASVRGRRLLAARWRRTVRFEYWPAWLLYLPLVPYLAWLALRHGGWRVPTAANPAIPSGGLVGESKGAILRALARLPGRVPATETIAAELAPPEKRARLAAFGARHGFPLVLKPDVGERGRGVRVARTPFEAEEALARAHGDVLLQAYVAGPEFGLLYARRPGAARGTLDGITAKLLPRVHGDGVRTLEQLILADARTAPMARFFFRTHSEALARVPAAGAEVRLGELGTHCRGATFLDASELATPELACALDELADALPGFHLGRYDVRAESAAALGAGRFLVLELNGIGAEPTHVYDPRHSALRAWRELARHWKRAFEFGAENLRRGARPSAWRQLWRGIQGLRQSPSSPP